jgi:DNA-binding protein H-NS
MSELNLYEYSVPDLKALAKDIEVEIKRRSEENRKKVLVQMKELAAGVGMSLEEVLAYSSAKKTKGEPKYQNPDNPKQTWTGRGKRPSWIKAAIERGTSLDDMKI